MSIKNKIYLSLAIYIAAFSVIIVFIIVPLFGEINDNSKELILQKQNLADLEEKIKNAEAFKNIYKEYKPNLEEIDKLFINAEVPVEFIAFLEKTAKDCGTEIIITPESSSKSADEFGSFLGFKLGATGSTDSFLTFLAKLEQAPYFIKIQNLRVGKDAESTENIIRAEISLKVYAK